MANVARLRRAERSRQLELLRADSVGGAPLAAPADARRGVLGSELRPCASSAPPSTGGAASSLELERRSARGQHAGEPAAPCPSTSRSQRPVVLTVRIATDAASLTPLARDSIFNRAFLDFLGGEREPRLDLGGGRRLEREVRSVELLSSEEKLMAGLPNFATYFGRDMMMAALMMRPIWRPAMSEHVIASVLRKLSPARRREPRGGARRPGDPRERRRVQRG